MTCRGFELSPMMTHWRSYDSLPTRIPPRSLTSVEKKEQSCRSSTMRIDDGSFASSGAGAPITRDLRLSSVLLEHVSAMVSIPVFFSSGSRSFRFRTCQQ